MSSTSTIDVPKDFISEQGMAEKIDKCVGTLRRWGRIGFGPKTVQAGQEHRLPRGRRLALAQWC
jgi:hypothetical protein